MACCEKVARTVLNGTASVTIQSGNTEGGRLRRLLKSCPPVPALVENNNCVGCLPKQSIQAEITPTEDSYLRSKLENCSVYMLTSGRINQQAAIELLRRAGSKNQYASEQARVEARVQATLDESTNPFNEQTRFAEYFPPPPPIVCPPLPPPPAPPARKTCIDQSKKYFTMS